MELFTFVFYFVDNLDTATLTRDIMAPVCPQHYLYMMYEASSQHVTTETSPTLKVIFSSFL